MNRNKRSFGCRAGCIRNRDPTPWAALLVLLVRCRFSAPSHRREHFVPCPGVVWVGSGLTLLPWHQQASCAAQTKGPLVTGTVQLPAAPLTITANMEKVD